MARVPAYHVHAFTAPPAHHGGLSGNPAVVMLWQAGLPEVAAMQQWATEWGVSETAHVAPEPPGSGWCDATRFALRWFTPTKEVALCGHATLATSHVLFRICRNPAPALSFATASGVLTVARADAEGVGADAGRLAMRFPANPPRLVEGGTVEDAVYRRIVAAAAGGADVGDLVAELAHSAATNKLVVHLRAGGDGEAFLRRLAPSPATLLAVDQSALPATQRVTGVSFVVQLPPPASPPPPPPAPAAAAAGGAPAKEADGADGSPAVEHIASRCEGVRATRGVQGGGGGRGSVCASRNPCAQYRCLVQLRPAVRASKTPSTLASQAVRWPPTHLVRSVVDAPRSLHCRCTRR
jgi:predicted PhzF superfamily epimerase YddE/YHI9